ncbi:long-chain fatty acid--CoA ligase [Streptomyces inhibens]|uniref:Long-chain fatty acid--CoA ligase n=1 Tax=Streptomyces inhibens TaxID=2293571 RepID=A0A371PUY8_STRIH|nr:long-chain fatty acid--CoA ligase [Streptomyces inhibens]REK86292.1 long-chain fatty acid--CoA ligase [Streptomyces inhibens]
MSLSAAAILAESAARRPEHPAVLYGTESVPYRELWYSARKYAAVLRDHGIGPGDKVALLLPNIPEFPAAYFGVLALGAVVVPVNTLLKSGEIEHVLRDSGAKVLVCAGPLLGEGAKSAAAAAVPVLAVLPGADADIPRLDELAAHARPIDHYVPCEPTDIALILYTSGTTGQAKGAMLTQLNVVMNVDTTMLSPFDFQPDDLLLGCLPLHHSFGQMCAMNACFRAGASLVLMERFDAEDALEVMERHRCTVFMGVPTMYSALLDAAELDGRRPQLDRAFSGGSALPVKTLQEFQATFGCQIYEGYGLTETSPVATYNQKAWPCRPGTVGRPIWGVEVEIARADVEGGIELLPTGELGEVVVRGHNVMAGYLNRPEATAEVVVDGWFRSGDLGVKDADGYLTILDRKKDLVLHGGFNVYPREVEEVLTGHPAIAQVAVIGLPHEVYGEVVCAVVVPRPGATPGPALAREIITWSMERLAAFKCPRSVEFVDAFPLGPSGKILKRELTATYASGRPTPSTGPRAGSATSH